MEAEQEFFLGGEVSSYEDKGRTEHPLLNPLILSLVFEFSDDKEDLENYRLVCKTWYHQVYPSWGKLAKLNICHQVEKKSYTSTWCQNPVPEPKPKVLMEELMTAFEKQNSDVDLEFKFQYFQNISVNLIRIQITDHFSYPVWALRCLKIKELHLTAPNEWGGDFTGFEISIVEKLPNLRRLVFDVICYSRRHICESNESTEEPPPQQHTNLKELEVVSHAQPNFPDSWVRFFQRFPNIESVCLEIAARRADGYEKYEDLKRLLVSAKQFLGENNDKNELKLKHLKIKDRCWNSNRAIPEKVVTLIEQLALPLETLELTLEHNSPRDRIEKIVRCHAATLRVLKLYRELSSEAFATFLSNTPMLFLTHLELKGIIISDLSFLRYTPNLEKLVINDEISFGESLCERRKKINVWSTKFISNTKQRCRMRGVKLTRLVVLETNFLVGDVDSMTNLIKWLPNVEIFQGGVTAESFPILCKNWSASLRELNLSIWSDFDDRVVAGASYKSCSKRLRKNITCLTNLQVFRMKIGGRRRLDEGCPHVLPCITDYAVQEGFMKLPKLRLLNICMTEKMDAESRMELEKKSVKVSVSVITSCVCGEITYRN